MRLNESLQWTEGDCLTWTTGERAIPGPNAKGLIETRPLDGLRINSPFSGSGGRIAENIDLYAEPFPLVA